MCLFEARAALARFANRLFFVTVTVVVARITKGACIVFSLIFTRIIGLWSDLVRSLSLVPTVSGGLAVQGIVTSHLADGFGIVGAWFASFIALCTGVCGHAG